MASLNEAIPVYVGVHATNHPSKSVARLVEAYGSMEGTKLAHDADALIAELFTVPLNWNQHTLRSGTGWAVAELRRVHPELDDEAAKALDWLFSYEWK